ncbi:MAG: hypothetical protein HC843_09440 [Sphingomonadales bacterium]|nr:hypothetical protein [Sphingomonadales bacterium]
MKQLSTIFAAWDNNAEALASAIDVPGVTVRQWRARKNIPARYWQTIIAAAAKKGVTLTLAMFLPGSNDASEPAGDPVDLDRVVICDVCDTRVDQMTACTFVDCPHSERRAA